MVKKMDNKVTRITFHVHIKLVLGKFVKIEEDMIICKCLVRSLQAFKN